MRPDNMPRPFAPEHSAKVDHVEVLKAMRSIQEMHERALLKMGIAENAPIYQAHAEKTAALTAAIAALDAVGKGVVVEATADSFEVDAHGNGRVRFWKIVLIGDAAKFAGQRVLIIPADAVDAVGGG